MITNEVKGLPSLQGRYGALLRPTGKLIADFYYYRFPDHVLIDVAPSLATPVSETLQKFVVMDEVYFEDIGDQWAHLSVQGPKSEELIRVVLNTAGPDARLGVGQVVWKGQAGWLIRKASLADQGFEILMPLEGGNSLREELLEARSGTAGVEIGNQAANILRLEQGIPLFGVDMTESNNPIEAGLREAISLDKGCFVGQEVVSKATYVGGVGRHLSQLLIRTDQLVDAGAEVTFEEGQPIGHVTSSAFSPFLEQTVALAYLKRDYAQAGRRLLVNVQSAVCEAQVVERARALMDSKMPRA